MGKNLFNKIWDAHKVKPLNTGQDQLFIGLHLIHEVTSPQAFQMLEDRDLSVLFPDRTVATVDHIVPTDSQLRPLTDSLAEEMLQALEKNVEKHGIRYFGLGSENQGIVHIIGPELGLTQPGMTIACGDSHTSTHGALGAIAFGIGTSQIRDVLATQTLAISRPKVRRILANGQFSTGIYSKDLILDLIRRLGVKAGIGFAYEYAGAAIEALEIEARLTVCNMSIEGGARAGYINPDGKTFDYLKNREFAPKGDELLAAVDIWKQFTSDKDADYNDQFEMNADDLEPTIAWGINPGQAVRISEKLPKVTAAQPEDRENLIKAYQHTEFEQDQPLSSMSA